MRSADGTLWFSPTDLSEYLGCAHATHLSLEEALGRRTKSHPINAYRDLIFRKGNEHEEEYLARLRSAGRAVETVGWGDPRTQSLRTAQLMREGVDVIYQGLFVVGGWRGLADFVERVDHDTALGQWGYEAV